MERGPGAGTPLAAVLPLVFASGFCALVYQVAWFRLFRPSFGISTASSAAVLAIFMAGLGVGGLVIGRRVDRARNPLALYAWLEAGIAAGAAASPFLARLAEQLYARSGGRLGLGAGAVPVQLALATLVLAVPTFLMGGTLPALARAVARSNDAGRRLLGWVYGVNTLGAVAGALVTTFVSLELLGVRRSLWTACLVNLLVAVAARAQARRAAAARERVPEPRVASAAEAVVAPDPVADPGRGSPRAFGLAAAALVGFAFFAMELVWYRMLAPLLGGSTYTFGLILATGLGGIGLGGLLYGQGAWSRRPGLGAFAAVCLVEALLLGVPLALGDRVAVLALLTRPLAAAGFGALVLSWCAVTALVVLPAALASGYQFPLLVGLVGRGERRVGREVGQVYAANTAGAIAGSLAGGFGLLPLLGAVGAWRSMVGLLVAVAVAALLIEWLRGRARPLPLLGGAALAVASLATVLAPGPTAFWRHSPIGVGRTASAYRDRNHLRQAVAQARRRIVWQADGVESTVGLDRQDGYSFLINGKSDGHCRYDAATQVMGGLVGAALHPDPRRALVIGLGTGSSAGWLARVEGMERVDVVELEPAVVEVAARCAAVNQDVLEAANVRLLLGDGRELLLTSSERYDIVFSEPSNPYRAGIASLFSREFYRAVEQRLRPGGIFLQWLQAYEVDARGLRTAYATLASVFPWVETWEVANGRDLVLLAARQPVRHDLERVRARLAMPAMRDGMRAAWGVSGVDGFYAAFVAGDGLARAIQDLEGEWVNSDDLALLEFGFGRTVGRSGLLRIDDLRALASSLAQDLPAGLERLDRARVEEARQARAVWEGLGPPVAPVHGDEAARQRGVARAAYRGGDLGAAARAWAAGPFEAEAHLDRVLEAEVLTAAGDERARAALGRLRRAGATEAAAVAAFALHGRGLEREAAAELERFFAACRSDPWVFVPLVERSLGLATSLSRDDPALARHLYDVLDAPFAVELLHDTRLETLWVLAHQAGFDGMCVRVFAAYEPSVPWEEELLAARADCYRRHRHPRAEVARRDLERFRALAPPRL